MKTNQMAQSLRYYTGILVKEYDVLRWADKGLLGEIDRFRVTTSTSKQRNFTDKNFERALLVVFLTRILHMPWSIDQIHKYLDTNDKNMSREIEFSLEKLEMKGIPRFKHILLERES